MSWSSNGGGGPQRPWGQGPRPPQPPDMEKVYQMFREKFGGSMDGKRLWPMAFGIILVIWLATGIYVVGPDEEGVVTRFGRYIESTNPGPHYHLPYPIEDVYKPKVTQVRRIEVGYRTRGRSAVDVAVESLMLTGDENIIDIDMSVQYRIHNAADLLFNVRNPPRDPSNVVRNVAETAIRQVIGRNSIDEALTIGKERIQANTLSTMQKILDDYKSGILIVAVQLQQVSPPEEVIHAFKDVASAREDRVRAINEAEGYANDILPKAKGEAAKQIQEAEAYKTAKVARAKGDALRFLSLLKEYARAPEVTTSRLYLETMEEVLTKTDKVVVDPRAGQGVLPYLPLDRQKEGIPPLLPRKGGEG
ncbi:MAG: FtsH protease activity modulator HflK [Magnetococcales bacterium]|nr:FtsH protease activity modulator HflK [Magnetococcales bacterium]MBF0323327.1 FtsH protease activity modulator HflK [Magnetococcales bacterium]